ncbi:hypothetical protein [Enterobacter cloacae complex sp. 2023EL-00624]|uniref:hypothetical protein n=1 Tax=Enterobacter cloacae complex sp. 2023EL-00624 TaxID=3394201 RepID=UPI0035C5D377|nr:hypothetical protein [Enterobacter cloacae]HCR0908647.1 hypothetical protein [Enterobacter cloacae]
MTIKNLTEESRFTKEQLIDAAKFSVNHWKDVAERYPKNGDYKIQLAVSEIALAALTAPDYIPPHVLDAMSDMCDGGFNAQGIWDLCRESIMPPAPCPRCGTVSDRPDGGHYCHVDAGQCGICAKCVPQINGGSGFSNCAEAHAAEIGQPCIAAIKGADANA